MNVFQAEGYAAQRLADPKNALERDFASAWRMEQSDDHGSPLLSKLVPDCTPDQARAVATVVQWMGTEVGQFFLRSVMKLDRS